jgi:predicted glycogen debranching enzyme
MSADSMVQMQEGTIMTDQPKTHHADGEALGPQIHFGREICGDLATAEKREWLVTNGIGGFASGTVAGLQTRRYHGLLFAALKPPLGRTLLASNVQESIEYDGRRYDLHSCRWADGSVSPEGFHLVESFRLEGTTPVWSYALGDASLEKRVWMEQGANTTYASYTLAQGCHPLRIEIKAFVNYRDYHSCTRAGGWRMNIERIENGLRVSAFDGATPFYLLSQTAEAEPAHDWYYNFDLASERYRGLDDREDHLHAGTFRGALTLGETLTIVASTDAAPNLDGISTHFAQRAHEKALLDNWSAAKPEASREAPWWVRQLVLAANQFVVSRPLADDSDGLSLIAGYHWFGDWGRDTMIALPGLTLTAGRPEIAARILRTFARFVDRGMLPNVFPDEGETPEYNTADAALWYFETVRQYVEATGDMSLLRDLYPVLQEIIDSHVNGTRYQIHVDPNDGLLYAGEAGVQLTWMDAKVGDWVVTPRIGKPVEINALWLNALSSMRKFAQLLGRSSAAHEYLLKRTRKGFHRFWNEAAQCCFDVLDGPNGNDPSIRPNQIFAVALPETTLTSEQQKAVVDTCARHLLTSHGLRSLAPDDPQYRGRYGGSPIDRDGSYHQGTVWAWLLGPFALAHLRVYNDPARAGQFLDPMADHLNVHGLGSISEIFDGDAPFQPRGCIAQAWSVAEVLRAWTKIVAARRESKPGRAMACNA